MDSKLFLLTLALFFKHFVSSDLALNRTVRIVKTSSKNYTSDDLERQGHFGGVTAFSNEFPYLVSLQYHSEEGGRLHHFCSGSLLNDRSVLTSARCWIDQLEIFLVAGEFNLALKDSFEQRIPVQRFEIHPEFNRSSGFADLALAIPEYPFELNSHVSSISLAEIGSKPNIGDIVAIPGWGSISSLSTALLKVYLPVTPCPESSPNSTICILETNDEDYDDRERSFCSVDLGSPAVKINRRNREVILIGIVSKPPTPRDCFNPSEPLTLTDVADFRPWIVFTQSKQLMSPHQQTQFRSGTLQNDRNVVAAAAATDVTKSSATSSALVILFGLWMMIADGE